MENKIKVNKVETQIYKVCQHCGRALPITNFYKYARGYRRMCKSCFCALTGRSDEFAQYNDNQLLLELQNRGYEGTLTIKIVKTKTI